MRIHSTNCGRFSSGSGGNVQHYHQVGKLGAHALFQTEPDKHPTLANSSWDDYVATLGNYFVWRASKALFAD